MTKQETKYSSEENTSLLRNAANYSQDILSNDPESTGVRENSIFNRINGYSVIDNLYADILHDIFEGVLRYDVCHVLLHFLKNKKFDIDLLNIRKQQFQYGSSEQGNKSQSIELNCLKKFRLKMSGREMWTFTHFLPLMIGDLVERNDIVWHFLINLVQILDLLLLPNYSVLQLTDLQTKIIWHNKKYTEIFQDTLKPKHHFLTHYIRIIENSGPLIHLWTFSFESKHRELKTYTKNITSRKNVLTSLGLKFCISFAKFLTSFHNTYYMWAISKNKLSTSDFFAELQKTLSEDDLKQSVGLLYYKKYGTRYQKGDIIFFYEPLFQPYIIREMYLIKECSYFLCQKIPIINYDYHFLSYQIDLLYGDYVTFATNEVECPPIHINILNNKYFLRPKNLF
ncbi:uncharacterized protein LOC142236148 [Haematobia irritans]|uniref:uncharacterized protein LOC142236148 n=1 Tax=Haematobia irritans TaxID=7368 RepID=UPI003F508C83